MHICLLTVASVVTDFTYEIPNEGIFLRAVSMKLKQLGRDDIVSLLKGTRCIISHNQQFSRRRYNAFATAVNFEVPISKYDEVMSHVTMDIRETIRTICDEVMPPRSGLDVMSADFSISLEEEPQREDLITALRKAGEELPPELRSEIIPDDVKEKAREMSEVYPYLYCAENALRAFIVKIAKEHYSSDYLTNLKLSREMKEKIGNRKKSKEKIKWLSVRGDSDIFYLDFEDLGTIIRNNWDIFDKYFQNQEWIVTNISEIAECRNPLAHNSYLEQHERDIIRTDFVKIMKQIGKAFE